MSASASISELVDMTDEARTPAELAPVVTRAVEAEEGAALVYRYARERDADADELDHLRREWFRAGITRAFAQYALAAAVDRVSTAIRDGIAAGAR